MIIANWKMQKTNREATSWCRKHKQELSDLIEAEGVPVAICPSFDAIDQVATIFKDSPVHVGAQDCAYKERGALTGEVSALSLKELGCSYCIVGHGEGCYYFQQTSKEIACKVDLLLKSNIVPVVCVGESREDRNNGRSIAVVQEQLKPVLDVAANYLEGKIIVAYEPVWAIGGSTAPTKKCLEPVLVWLKDFVQNHPTPDIKLFYGGSVSPKNIDELMQIKEIEGFLVGTASLEFQQLKSIVLSIKKAIF